MTEPRCPYYSQQMHVRCELHVGHQGLHQHAKFSFGGGYIPKPSNRRKKAKVKVDQVKADKDRRSSYEAAKLDLAGVEFFVRQPKPYSGCQPFVYDAPLAFKTDQDPAAFKRWKRFELAVFAYAKKWGKTK